MQQPLWLIKSKQRAFNPIHGFFSIREQPVKHNEILHAKQRGGRHRPHLLSGIASGKLAVGEQLAAQMAAPGRPGGKPFSDGSSVHGRAIWGLQAEKQFLMPLGSIQVMGGETTRKEKAHEPLL